MKMAKVDFSDREFLVGHKHSRGLDVNYDRTDEWTRLTEWAKAIPYLTIDTAFRTKVKLKKVEGEQAQEIAKLKAYIQNIESLQTKHEEASKSLEAKVLQGKHHVEDVVMPLMQEIMPTLANLVSALREKGIDTDDLNIDVVTQAAEQIKENQKAIESAAAARASLTARRRNT